MDASELYALRNKPCKECDGGGIAFHDDGSSYYCPCNFSDGGTGVTQVKIPLIDALRALGIDVPEQEDEPPAMIPP